MVTRNEVESLKSDRSLQKKKITTLLNRYKRGSDVYTNQEISSLLTEIKNAYLDFLSIQEEYEKALEENDGEFMEEYSIVNNLDLREYAASVTEVYNEVLASEAAKPEILSLKILLTEANRKYENISGSFVNIQRSGSMTPQAINSLKYDKEQLEKVSENLTETFWNGIHCLGAEKEEAYKVYGDLETKIDTLVKDISLILSNPPTLDNLTDQSAASPMLSRGRTLERTSPVWSSSTSSTHGISPYQPSPSSFSSVLPPSISGVLPSSISMETFIHTNPTGTSAINSLPQPAPSVLPPSVTATLPNRSMATTVHGYPTVTDVVNLPFYPSSSTLGSQVNLTCVPIHNPTSQSPFYSSASVANSLHSSVNPLGVLNPRSPSFPAPAPNNPLPQLPIPPLVPNPTPDVKVKRMNLPKFDGSRNSWPEFKVLWPKLAVPTFKADQETLALQLKQSCSGTASDLISSISSIGDQPFNIMWERLVQYYDDSASTVRATIKRLQKLKTVKEEDYAGLTHFINEVESAYSMLTTLNQVQCLTLIQVDELAELLPPLMKKEWNRIYHRLLPEQRNHPFPFMMSFLIEERNVISRLVENEDLSKKKRGSNHSGGTKKPAKEEKKEENKRPSCAIHRQGAVAHKTIECSVFKKLNVEDKMDALRAIGACFRCCGNHKRSDCRERRPCDKCGDLRHPSILCKRSIPPTHNRNASQDRNTSHNNDNRQSSTNLPSVTTSSSSVHSKTISLYAIFSVPVNKTRYKATVFTDDGSDSSYITSKAAERLGARKLGKYSLEVTTTGGVETDYESYEYALELVTSSGKIITVHMFAMDKITSRLSKLNLSVLDHLFPGFNVSSLQRERTEVDILLGTDYFGLHPKHEIRSVGENLSIMKGALGVCLQGSHPDLVENMCFDMNFVKTLNTVTPLQTQITSNHSSVAVHPVIANSCSLNSSSHCSVESHFNAVDELKVMNFIKGEELSTQIDPKCGSCKCTKCPLPGHTYSFKEEAELRLIREGLKYKESDKVWITKYPWKVDPYTLPNNESAAFSSLQRLKKKLKSDKTLAKIYSDQMNDMVQRGVSREISQQELDEYKGPCFYINHLGVPNPKSQSTPFRIVFDSSRTYKGISLNDCLYKGPDSYLNSQLSILLRWRENEVALVGDIKKMYNSVILEEVEQHCHRYLWSDVELDFPKTYVITRVNMGDKPAGAISTEALYLTAEKFKEKDPVAAEMLRSGSYVDDIVDSAKSREDAKELANGAENILFEGGFRIKFWLFSGDNIESDVTEVLGVKWFPFTDMIAVQSSINFSPKKRGVHTLPDLKPSDIPNEIPDVLTKRLVLSQVMKIYDPMGIWSPVSLRGRLLLRKTWEMDLGWDDNFPQQLHDQWIDFFISIKYLSDIQYPRWLKPDGAVGDPMLVIFSDASDTSYGFAAYARWPTTNGSFLSRLILAKCRVAPLTKRSTPQLELNAAVLAKRGREVIMKEMRYKFTTFLHIVDSETVLCMLQKTSTRFNLYEGVRIGEIQASTGGDVSCWAWIAGKKNISDWLTRGKSPQEIGASSEWFCGPSYMIAPVEEWGLKYSNSDVNCTLPGEKKISKSHNTQVTSPIVDYSRFNNYYKLRRVLARILNFFLNKNFFESITPDLLKRVDNIILHDAQRQINSECEKLDKRGRVGGKFKSLKPVKVNGLWVVGTRLMFNPLVPENDPQVLIPSNHPVTKLLMVKAHEDSCHRGRDATLARFRQSCWVTHGSKIARAVVSNCQFCIN